MCNNFFRFFRKDFPPLVTDLWSLKVYQWFCGKNTPILSVFWRREFMVLKLDAWCWSPVGFSDLLGKRHFWTRKCSQGCEVSLAEQPSQATQGHDARECITVERQMFSTKCLHCRWLNQQHSDARIPAFETQVWLCKFVGFFLFAILWAVIALVFCRGWW